VDNNQSRFNALFEKYLAGQATPAEVTEILRYFELDEEQGGIRELINNELSRNEPGELEDNDITIDAVHQSILDDIRGSQAVRPVRSRILTWFPRAAAVWLLIIASAGAISMLLSGSFNLSWFDGTNRIVTKAGEKREIRMSDGTIVWLNAASSLRYPDEFDGNTREVMLEGEAFFDVARDSSRPFTIHSGEVETRVLGTSFNIKAYHDDATISVGVLTGKVQVTETDSKKAFQLLPDQQVVFNKKNKETTKREGGVKAGLLAWKEGKAQFRNNTFAEVMTTLERTYGVTIRFDPQLENCSVHADFEDNEPISKVLEKLLLAMDGKVHEEGKQQYYLTGKSCIR
jgi:transmembrane sensor